MSAMSVAGLCEVCEAAPIDDGCDRCGRLLCDRHHDEQTGLCPSCSAEVVGADPSDRSPSGSPGGLPDGVDEYQF